MTIAARKAQVVQKLPSVATAVAELIASVTFVILRERIYASPLLYVAVGCIVISVTSDNKNLESMLSLHRGCLKAFDGFDDIELRNLFLQHNKR